MGMIYFRTVVLVLLSSLVLGLLNQIMGLEPEHLFILSLFNGAFIFWFYAKPRIEHRVLVDLIKAMKAAKDERIRRQAEALEKKLHEEGHGTE